MIPGRHLAAALLMGIATFIAVSLPRTEFVPLVTAFSASFLMYILIIQKPISRSLIKYWIIVAILLRVITVFYFPQLSDDIYRFIWDGQLLSQGINPFNQLPSTYISEGDPNIIIDQALFAKLNSPDYFTIYPPFCQFLFWIGASLFPGHWFGQSVLLKVMMLFAEIGSMGLIYRILKRLKKPLHWVLIYALNPLVIIELCGNIHFEGWMIFFLLAGYYAFLTQKQILGGIAFAFGFVTKLIPAIVSPFLIKRLSFKALAKTILPGLLFVVLAFLPFINLGFSGHFGDSLNLYFQKFEYNASIYYLLRWIGFQIYGYNQIQIFGPLLASIFVLLLLFWFLTEKNPTWETMPAMIVFVLTAYFILGTTVHPWYITTIVAFASLTHWRYPVIWSFMIFLTYINYRMPEFREDLVIVFVEYAVVCIFAFVELKRIRQSEIQLK